jgi:homoserine kinase
VLPKSVPLSQLVAQTAAVASVMDALYSQDIQRLASAMESDSVIEPARAHLMPKLREVRAAAKGAGALGVVISGAGPTLCAICDDNGTAHAVSEAMYRTYQNAGIQCVSYVTRAAPIGASGRILA